MGRSGFELPMLLASSLRAAIDALHVELDRLGHDRARPAHGFALYVLGPDGASVAELGRRLGVSRQAAAKTAETLERLGYVERAGHPQDRRAVLLRRSRRGEELILLIGAVFDDLRAGWASRLGDSRLDAVEDALRELAGDHAGRVGDLPGRLR
jgi:DNA-binding MarR family transcriptional regulator